MNLSKLFEMQRELDEHIIREKHLEGRDLIPMKILALQGELSELVNEVPEYWKFWSNKKNNMKKALEEFADCLHFVITIGLEMGLEHAYVGDDFTSDNVIKDFNDLHHEISRLFNQYDQYRKIKKFDYGVVLNLLIGIGEKHLGFTWKEIEQSYCSKNRVNHQRQMNGY